MKKILLVDDVKLLLEIQKKFLEASDVQVLTAADGIEALEIALRERPDLIVMDKYMPNMDGLSCCKAIKADPTIAHIPIIMVTTATNNSDWDEYIAAGYADFLCKPLEVKTFLNTIKQYIADIEQRDIRIPVDMQMKVLHNSDCEVKTANISINGAFALTDMKVAVNEELKFSFLLPERKVPMEVKGRVVWQQKSGAAPGFGIEFIEVTGQGISFLRMNELKGFVTSRVSGAGLSHKGNQIEK